MIENAKRHLKCKQASFLDHKSEVLCRCRRPISIHGIYGVRGDANSRPVRARAVVSTASGWSYSGGKYADARTPSSSMWWTLQPEDNPVWTGRPETAARQSDGR
nr:hypothetical protein CFP56_43934 [Quercus suber]